jgi:hypothetical protein
MDDDQARCPKCEKPEFACTCPDAHCVDRPTLRGRRYGASWFASPVGTISATWEPQGNYDHWE